MTVKNFDFIYFQWLTAFCWSVCALDFVVSLYLQKCYFTKLPVNSTQMMPSGRRTLFFSNIPRWWSHGLVVRHFRQVENFGRWRWGHQGYALAVLYSKYIFAWPATIVAIEKTPWNLVFVRFFAFGTLHPGLFQIGP